MYQRLCGVLGEIVVSKAAFMELQLATEALLVFFLLSL